MGFLTLRSRVELGWKHLIRDGFVFEETSSSNQHLVLLRQHRHTSRVRSANTTNIDWNTFETTRLNLSEWERTWKWWWEDCLVPILHELRSKLKRGKCWVRERSKPKQKTRHLISAHMTGSRWRSTHARRRISAQLEVNDFVVWSDVTVPWANHRLVR